MSAARTALDESGKKGEFKRVDAVWRDWISNGKHKEILLS